VGTLDSNVREVGIVRQRLDLEDESGSESCMAVPGMAQEEAIRLKGIRGEEETTDRDSEEVIGSFEHRGFGVPTFGMTIANEETGDIEFDKALVEISE
jgi:hypothetical protein